MARTHPISKEIYKRHLRLIRYLNDAWIFLAITRPELQKRAVELRASKSKAKKRYPVPKRDTTVDSMRRDSDVGDIFQVQCERGLFETNIVSIVSRVEAFIQECLAIAICEYPQKLATLDDKSVPLDLFLKHEDRDDLIERVVALRCQDLMFLQPKEYLAKVAKVLSIEIDAEIAANFIEMKATRDIIIHNQGQISQIYVTKAGKKKRGKVGEELEIDLEYFGDVIVNAKLLSGNIQRETEQKYK
jgi:hypothetical protein